MTSSTSNTSISKNKLNTIMCTTSTIESYIESPGSVSSTAATYATSPQYSIGSYIDSPGSVSSTPKNLCVECGIDMGDQNPRQLCGKTICYEDL